MHESNVVVVNKGIVMLITCDEKPKPAERIEAD
jgi:hypothetical protein